MSTVVFQARPGHYQASVLDVGDGGPFHLEEALYNGGGVFSLDDSKHSHLVGYLRNHYDGLVEREDLAKDIAPVESLSAYRTVRIKLKSALDALGQAKQELLAMRRQRDDLVRENSTLRQHKARLERELAQGSIGLRMKTAHTSMMEGIAQLHNELDITRQARDRAVRDHALLRMFGDIPLKGSSPGLGSIQRPVGPTVAYEILPNVDITTIKGATTSQPPDQSMVDVYSLISPLLGELIGTHMLPVTMGASPSARKIYVEQGSNIDIALSAFPTLVRRSASL